VSRLRDFEVAPPEPERVAVLRWVHEHLGHVVDDEVTGSRIAGGQTAANQAMATFDVSGYARRRNEVWPISRRGASGLSPYIRHGLLALPYVWDAVAGGPSADVSKFRDELLWQEYARHLYARVGYATAHELRFDLPDPSVTRSDPWESDAACIGGAWGELTADGWLTNQQRMWLASHWQVRHQAAWRLGEDRFFRHLLDGSRAANRVGWQWVVGALTGKPYGFSRWQVEKRAPGLCNQCPLHANCPIEDWPAEDDRTPQVATHPSLRRDSHPDVTAGPTSAMIRSEPDTVWLTAESLGDSDPALSAHPDLPVVFVFDEPLLTRLRLSAKRLVFLAECLADLGQRRNVRVYVGRPAHVLAGVALAATFAPVPGFRRLATDLNVVALHPWPWLRQPRGGSVTSFTSWSRSRR
jgi:deoxyribodipyrimidine photo-lyase